MPLICESCKKELVHLKEDDLPKISTTITKKFFEMKVADLKEFGYFLEYKEDKPFWKKRLDKFKGECDIVFLVGKEPHRFKAKDVIHIPHNLIQKKYQSAIYTDYAYAIRCEEPPEKTIVIAGTEVLKDNDIFTVGT